MCAKKQQVETKCIVVSGNTGYKKDTVVLNEDGLLHQILNDIAVYIHLSEDKAHKFKLDNFDYERVDKFCYLGIFPAQCWWWGRSKLNNPNQNKFEEIQGVTATFDIERVFSHKMKGII